MKLSYLALIMTLLLLAVTAWMAWDQHNDAVAKTKELELYQRKDMAALQPPGQIGLEALHQREKELVEQRNATTPGNASAPSENLIPQVAVPPPPPPPPMPAHIVTQPPGSISPPMTEWEKKVLSLPALAKISEYQRDYGFVVINAGTDRNISVGSVFALRRYNAVVGRVKITSVEEGKAVGDIESQSTPPGVVIEVGDDVIQNLDPRH